MAIKIKRVYEYSGTTAGPMFLADRLWPRGIRKEELKNVDWVRDVAPSSALRKWFGHDPKKWHGFSSRYFRELDEHPESWLKILQAARKGNATLLYGAKDTEHNQAVALKAYLDKKLDHSHASRSSNSDGMSHVVAGTERAQNARTGTTNFGD